MQILKSALAQAVPGVRSLQQQRNNFAQLATGLAAELEKTKAELAAIKAAAAHAGEIKAYLELSASVMQYQQAHFEAHGRIAPEPAIPTARAYPEPHGGKTYEEKLVGSLNLAGKGAELGPLQIPVVTKAMGNVLYIDHLDTAGIKAKYPTIPDLVDIDRPIVNNSLVDTLKDDAPLDYLVASQVLEHVANPIKWLREIATILRDGGRLGLSLPDRRTSFDLLREEAHPADMVAAYLEDATVPNVRAVYEHHAQTTLVNMKWARPESVTPQEVVDGRGAVKPPKVTDDHMGLVEQARGGEYLDVHAWVFTPPTFLLLMAQLAGEGLLPFRLQQFYPTTLESGDRNALSFVAIFEKAPAGSDPAELRRSFLLPLGS